MEYVEGINPGAGFRGGGFVVRIGGALNWADGEEIWENKRGGHWCCRGGVWSKMSVNEMRDDALSRTA